MLNFFICVCLKYIYMYYHLHVFFDKVLEYENNKWQ